MRVYSGVPCGTGNCERGEEKRERESKRVARSRVASRSRERGKVREEERAAGAKNGEEKEAARKRNKDAVVAENSGLPDDQATSCETHGRSLKDTAVFVSGGWTALCRRRNELRARRAALDSYMTTTLFYEPDCSTSSRRLAERTIMQLKKAMLKIFDQCELPIIFAFLCFVSSSSSSSYLGFFCIHARD